MSFREVGMFDVKEVLRLHLAGVPRKQIAFQVGLDVKTVRRYCRAAERLGLSGPLDDTQFERVLAALQPAVERDHGEAWGLCEQQREFVKGALADGLRLTKVRKLLERRDVRVPYSTLHRYAVEVLDFGRSAPTVAIIDGQPGQEVQIDTGWVLTLDEGGKRRRKKAFIFTPSFSRYRFAYPIERETTVAAIEACEAAWEFYGGIFPVIIPDNTKAIVIQASDTSPRITDAFREYAQARGITVDPARVRHPRDKGRVERSVRVVRDDCFAGENLRTLEEARRRAIVWSTQEHGLRVHSTTQRRPKEHFEGEERSHLLPAPTERWDPPAWSDVKVGRDQYVRVEKALYLLPSVLVGEQLRARADASLVRFYQRGLMVKVLPRQPPGGRAYDPSDIPEPKRAYALRNPGLLVEEARPHGPKIGRYAELLVEGPAPWMRMRRVSALLGLVRRYGAVRVESVCGEALQAEMVDVDRLRRMLERPSPKPGSRPLARVIPIAKYLRPASTYAVARPTVPEGTEEETSHD
jgi:Mu transposase-like protein